MFSTERPDAADLLRSMGPLPLPDEESLMPDDLEVALDEKESREGRTAMNKLRVSREHGVRCGFVFLFANECSLCRMRCCVTTSGESHTARGNCCSGCRPHSAWQWTHRCYVEM